jgi:dTDP-glucose 4,6-dehydratase
LKRVLLTGAGGFIGHHCLRYFLDKTDWFVVCLDSFRHKGTYSRLAEVDLDPERVLVLQHDLSVPIDEALGNRIMGRTLSDRGTEDKRLDMIVNMASDSAVERSVSDPSQCWRNNCDLALNMLEFARRAEPDMFVQVSSDEVYGDCPDGHAHPEWDVITPSNPYAASKAAQEALAISYFRTYDVPVVITNTMNTIGTCQDKEKFLPKIIWKVATGQKMEIYADPKPDGSFKIGTRFYLHAENHADVFVWLSGRSPARYSLGHRRPDRYNVVGDVELDNLQLAEMVAEIMGKPLLYELVSSESARPGYDRRYALDGSMLRDLGWTPPVGFREGLERIVRWTLDHPWWI